MNYTVPKISFKILSNALAVRIYLKMTVRPGSGTLPEGLSDGLEDEPPPLRILAHVQELAALRQPDLLLEKTQLEYTF